MSNSVVYQTQMIRMLHFINFDCLLMLYISVKCINMYKPNDKLHEQTYNEGNNEKVFLFVFLLFFIVSMQK